MRVRVGLDRVVAAVLLVVLGPLILALALVVRFADRGPGFVAVPRVGRHGRTFTMWKLRSMRADSPDGRAEGISLTSTNDDRITPVGVKLRAYYLDELPQLWNVVKGDMCLLGARPEAPEYVDEANPGWQLVLDAPPGLAGPTQLMVNDWERHLITACGAGSIYTDEVVPVKLAIDGWYVSSSSPRLDALVAMTLFRRFMPGTGANTLKRRIRRDVPESHAVEEDVAVARLAAVAARAPSSVQPATGPTHSTGSPTPRATSSTAPPTSARPAAFASEATGNRRTAALKSAADRVAR